MNKILQILYMGGFSEKTKPKKGEMGGGIRGRTLTERGKCGNIS